MYRVDQQCCPGGNRFNIYMAGITSDLAKKSGDLSGWSPDNFRRDNIAGPHGR